MPEDSQDNPEQELGIEDQLDALLAKLETLEPDLLKQDVSQQESPEATAEPQADDGGSQSSGEADVPDQGQPPADTPLPSSPGQAQVASDVPATDQPPPAEANGTAGQIDALLSQQISEKMDELLDAASESSVDSESGPSDVSDDGPTAQAVADQGDEDLTAVQIDQLLQQQMAQQLDEAEAADVSESAKPGAVAEESSQDEAVAVERDRAELVAAATDDPSDKVDIAEQLQSLIDSAAAEPATAPPPAMAQEDQAQPLVQAEPDQEPAQELSLEQIDQLLADEAQGNVGEEFGGGASQVIDLTPQSATDASSQASEEAGQEGGAEQGAQGPSSAGGFNADANAVAKELDEQPERNATVAGGQVSQTADQPAPKRAGLKLNKEQLLAKAVVGERVLRQVCVVINRPVRSMPPFVRDAVGYVAVFNGLFGALLIFGKLIGMV